MATHSSFFFFFAWEIPWTEGPDGLQYSPWGCKRVRHDLVTKQKKSSKQIVSLSSRATQANKLNLRRRSLEPLIYSQLVISTVILLPGSEEVAEWTVGWRLWERGQSSMTEPLTLESAVVSVWIVSQLS